MSHYYSKNPDVLSNPQEINYHFKNKLFKFKTDNGVFSKQYVDFGTNLLLNSITINNIESPLLDLCCGYGVVGIVLKSQTNKEVYATDINERAVLLTKENAKINNVNINVYSGNMFENIPDISFSQILLNPPIRAGKTVVFNLYLESYNHLVINGELDIVIQKKQGKDSTLKYLKELFKEVNIINKDKGYFIIQAIK